MSQPPPLIDAAVSDSQSVVDDGAILGNDVGSSGNDGDTPHVEMLVVASRTYSVF